MTGTMLCTKESTEDLSLATEDLSQAKEGLSLAAEDFSQKLQVVKQPS